MELKFKICSKEVYTALNKTLKEYKSQKGIVEKEMPVINNGYYYAGSGTYYCHNEKIDISSLEEEISKRLFKDLNELRENENIFPLILDEKLSTLCETRALEIHTYWSHERPNKTYGVDMFNSIAKGENLATSTYSEDEFSALSIPDIEMADHMFKNLVASPGHYRNMMRTTFHRVGIATYVYRDEMSTFAIYSAFLFSD